MISQKTQDDNGVIIFESGTLEGNIRNGQIRYCALQGGNGNLHKTRPCIILQADEYNKNSNSRVFVVPMSSHVEDLDGMTDKLALFMNYENKESKLSYVCIDRSVFVNRSDVGAIIGQAPTELLVAICQILFARIIVKGEDNYVHSEC